MKPRPFQTVYYWRGLRCHWRIISRYDQSEIASGSALKLAIAKEQAKNARAEIQNANHRCN